MTSTTALLPLMLTASQESSGMATSPSLCRALGSMDDLSTPLLRPILANVSVIYWVDTVSLPTTFTDQMKDESTHNTVTNNKSPTAMPHRLR